MLLRDGAPSGLMGKKYSVAVWIKADTETLPRLASALQLTTSGGDHSGRELVKPFIKKKKKDKAEERRWWR